MTDLRERLQAALGDAYRVERELGGGGMSYVFVALDVHLGRRVVVKVLPPDMAAGVSAERFKREIQLAASLQHPHVVPLHAAAQAGDLFYYTMPLVEGESLRDRLSRDKRLPIPVAVRILRDVVDALAYAHRQGVVHRDIKPDNVLVSSDHGVVTDFGVAKALGHDSPGVTLTQAGLAIGTPAYMAPEQAAGDPNADHRCDIYAAGTLAYEMLTGRPPFEGSTPQSVLAAQLTEPPPPIERFRPDVPASLAAIIMRCLAKDPAERWQTADELLHQIDAVATPGTTARVTAAYAGARPWWRRAPVAAFALAAVLALGWLGRWLVAGRADTGSPSVIAVFPFAVRGSAAVAYLGEGMVNLLSTSLNGAGDLRSADPRALLALVQREHVAAADPEGAARVAGRLGAGLYVLGDVTEVGDSLRLDAALYDRSKGSEPVGNVRVDGTPAEVFRLVDQVAAQLLAAGSAGPGTRATRLAAVTTTSLPALKAYLEGESDFRAGRFVPAVESFQRAVAADSQFALAYYRLSIAAEWALRFDLASSASATAARYADKLGDHDRMLLQALEYGRASQPEQGVRAYRAIVSTYPDDVEAWMQLGEVLFHYGPLLGQPIGDAREAFLKVLAYEPENATALVHLARAASAVGDTAAVDTLVSRIMALNPDGERAAEMVGLRALASDSAALSAATAELRRAGDLALPQAIFAPTWSNNLPGARALIATMTEPARPADLRAIGDVALAHLDVLEGHLRAARVRFTVADSLDHARALEHRALLALAPFVPTSRPALDTLRRTLERWNAAAVPAARSLSGYYGVHEGLHVMFRHYLLGQVTARLGDLGAARAEAAALEREGPRSGQLRLAGSLSRGVRAAILEQEGRAREAVDAFGALDIFYEPAIFSPFYSRALDRWRHATLLDSLGRLDEAARWYRTFRDFSFLDRPFEAPAEYRLGRIAERQGKPDEARRRYTRFAALWHDCDPELRPMLDSANAALARLGARR